MHYINSDIIQAQQNQEQLLKAQYAARACFNSAEFNNTISWFLYLIAAFSIFMPDNWTELIQNAIAFFATLIGTIFYLNSNYQVRWAARIRKYIDSYLFDINKEQFSESDNRKIKEKIQSKYIKNKQNAITQVNNTGRDTPPGVRNWYEFSKFYDGIEAIFECQRQNSWWNKKLTKIRIIVSCTIFLITTLVFISFATDNDLFHVLFSSLGIITKILDNLVQNYKYMRISFKINDTIELLECELSMNQIIKLQDFIDQRRAINILELNWAHKLYASKFSKTYEDISQ